MKTELQQMPMEVRILAIYDSVEGANGAKALCDNIERFLGVKYELHLHRLDMAALENPTLAQSAMEAIEWPTVAIITVNGDKPLPEYFKQWLSRCTRKTCPAIGVIAARIYDVQPTKQELTHAHMDLKQIARDAWVPFVSEASEASNEDLNRTIMRAKLVE